MTSIELSVHENMSPSEALLEVTATDLDRGKNAEVRFRIKNRLDSDFFEIRNSSKGVINFVQSPDYERNQELNFVVEAFDLADQPRSTLLDVKIILIDEDDNGPVFFGFPPKISKPPAVQLNVEENFLGKVSLPNDLILDRDSARNRDNDFFVFGPKESFEISKNGSDFFLIIKKELDFEAGRTVFLNIGCKRVLEEPFSIEEDYDIRKVQDVILKVQDKNDNPPEFSNPSLVNRTDFD